MWHDDQGAVGRSCTVQSPMQSMLLGSVNTYATVLIRYGCIVREWQNRCNNGIRCPVNDSKDSHNLTLQCPRIFMKPPACTTSAKNCDLGNLRKRPSLARQSLQLVHRFIEKPIFLRCRFKERRSGLIDGLLDGRRDQPNLRGLHRHPSFLLCQGSSSERHISRINPFPKAIPPSNIVTLCLACWRKTICLDEYIESREVNTPGSGYMGYGFVLQNLTTRPMWPHLRNVLMY